MSSRFVLGAIVGGIAVYVWGDEIRRFAAEIGIDEFQAQRSPDGRYRTTPLKGLFTRTKGGFYPRRPLRRLRGGDRGHRSANAELATGYRARLSRPHVWFSAGRTRSPIPRRT